MKEQNKNTNNISRKEALKNAKLVIIDNLAEEHILNYDDIIKI